MLQECRGILFLQLGGYENLSEMLDLVEGFIVRYDETPLEAMIRLVQENQLVFLG